MLPSSLQSLRRVFHQSFSVHDIAEPIVSCDQSSDATEMRAFMDQHGYEVMGVRSEGLVVAYLERTALAEGVCGTYAEPFGDHQIILDSAPLADVILGLNEVPRLFVSVFGRVGGIVTRSDLLKPPVRMWLFGIVTLIEMRMTRMIERSGIPWAEFLSEGRLAKANELLAERTRRNQHLDLISCLQFSDKCQIIARCEPLRGRTRYESRRQLEDAAKRFERLRNNLAHAQDIVSNDWDALVQLAENLDGLVTGPAEDAGQPQNGS